MKKIETPEVQVQVETPKVKAITIGAFASNLILTTSKSNTEILETVLAAYPSAKTTMACVAWYKSDLRKKGSIPARVKKVKALVVKALVVEAEPALV